VGFVELQRAIQQSTALGFTFDIDIRPFLLMCMQNNDAVSKESYLRMKMGAERWEACKQALAVKGEECGISLWVFALKSRGLGV
jgi:predicted DsbA family dithiol-disulfide isomerase